jgi:hypothetical protein
MNELPNVISAVVLYSKGEELDSRSLNSIIGMVVSITAFYQ